MSKFYLKVSVTKDGEFVINAKTEEEALERELKALNNKLDHINLNYKLKKKKKKS